MSIPLQSEYEVETCIHEKCGVHFAVPSLFQKERKRDHKMFYCPNGHGQYYSGKSDIEKLKDELAEKNKTIYQNNNMIDDLLQRERDLIQSRAAYKAHLTRRKNKSKSA